MICSYIDGVLFADASELGSAFYHLKIGDSIELYLSAGGWPDRMSLTLTLVCSSLMLELCSNPLRACDVPRQTTFIPDFGNMLFLARLKTKGGRVATICRVH